MQPIISFGPVAQMVRALACHARGRGFKSLPDRQYALIAQSVEQRTENPCVGGSIPPQGTIDANASKLTDNKIKFHLNKKDFD